MLIMLKKITRLLSLLRLVALCTPVHDKRFNDTSCTKIWSCLREDFHKTPKYRRSESWNASAISRAHVPGRYNYNMKKSNAFFIKHGSRVMPEQFQRCKDNGLIITADYWIVIIALKCHWRAGGENLWIKSVGIGRLWKVKLNECAQYHCRCSEVVKRTLLSCAEW